MFLCIVLALQPYYHYHALLVTLSLFSLLFCHLLLFRFNRIGGMLFLVVVMPLLGYCQSSPHENEINSCSTCHVPVLLMFCVVAYSKHT